MTLRLTLGCDIGQTGAIACLADGQCVQIIDMPTMPRKAGGQMIDAASLAQSLRTTMRSYFGAHFIAAVEQVSAMPGNGGSSMFRFGQSDGMLRGVLAALGIPIVEVSPQAWKRHHGLLGTGKDVSRTVAIQKHPLQASSLSRKKDIGRADALLIADWCVATEQAARL